MNEVREVSVHIIPDLSGIEAAFQRISAAIRLCGEAMRRAGEDAHWNTRIILADTEKERRLLRREYARATRKPALIHNGRKPR